MMASFFAASVGILIFSIGLQMQFPLFTWD
jgi:hypothetical protein